MSNNFILIHIITSTLPISKQLTTDFLNLDMGIFQTCNEIKALCKEGNTLI